MWLVQPGQTIWNKCVFRCDLNCSLATVICAQLQSIENWHYPRLSLYCCSSENLNLLVFGRIASAQHTAPRYLPVFGGAQERCHPIPNPTPPHHDLRSNTEQVARNVIIPSPNPPHPPPFWSPANDNDCIYRYAQIFPIIHICTGIIAHSPTLYRCAYTRCGHPAFGTCIFHLC